MGNNNNLINIAAKYDEAIDRISKEFISELKEGCKTYGEVFEKLDVFIRETRWNNITAHHMTILIPYIKDILNKEKNDLPLTNRSE